ncbi:MAG: Colicin V production protein [Parcubacteria group bacterium ADurb.Bin316]|nr:MAG: Colicin V production protein [Parcubacteria group bacterium ADurb.Bin316]HOZ55838.1 CvpA family protein [bacterium]
MSIFDVVLLISLAGFVFYGLFFGLIRTFGTFTGVLVGAFLASRFYLSVAEWLDAFFFGYNNLGKVLVFILLFSLFNRLTGFVFYLLDRAFNIISIIPFLKTFNRLGGAILGFITGSLILGLILYVASRYALIGYWFGDNLVDSKVAPFLLKMANLLLPLLPEVLKKVQSLI